MASRAIFIGAPICVFRFVNAKRKIGSAGILPACSGILAGTSSIELRRLEAGWCGQDARAPALSSDRQYLPAFIISAGGTSDVRWDGAAALRAFVEVRRLPAMRSLARAQAHLRSFAFWNSHKSESGKQEIEIRQQGSDFRIQRNPAARDPNLKPEPFFLLQLQLIQCAPVRRTRFEHLLFWRILDRGRHRANAAALAIAMRIRRQVEQNIFAQKGREIDFLGTSEFDVHGEIFHVNIEREWFEAPHTMQFDWLR